MMTFIAIIHILVALVLISLVLIQDSKGGGLGIGGGSSNSLLGATGATTLAAKATRVAAVIFAMTCFGLSVMTAKKPKSVLDTVPVSAATAAPVTSAPVAVPGSTPGASPGTLPGAATGDATSTTAAPESTPSPEKK